jgi:transketolase
MKPSKPHDSMKGYFSYYLYDFMKNYPEMTLLTGDLGYGMFDSIRDDLPKQFINVGASEQTMLDMAVGMALSGKMPICYSITPFLIFRPFETIRTYIDRECIPVKLVGGGRDKDYLHDGFSHYAHDVKPHLDLFENIVQFWPTKKEEMPKVLEYVLFNDKPSFLSLSRE